MKIAVNNNNYRETPAQVKAIPEASLSDQKMIMVSPENGGYFYYANATSGDFQPDDASTNKGWWIEENSLGMFNALAYLVADDYDFVSANATDITTIGNWERYDKKQEKDYLYINENMALLARSLVGQNFENFLTLTPDEQFTLARYIPNELGNTLGIAIVVQQQRFFDAYGTDHTNTVAQRIFDDFFNNFQYSLRRRFNTVSLVLVQNFGDEASVLLLRTHTNLVVSYEKGLQVDLRAYINSTDMYVGNGLAEAGLTIITSLTMPEIIGACNQVLDGNY